eukprot:15347006-Ditylum_brightwellii.AAC.1
MPTGQFTTTRNRHRVLDFSSPVQNIVFQAGEKAIQFQGPVDGHPSCLQSYRAELTGILTIYHMLKCLKCYSKENFGIEITAHVDNITAVNANNQHQTYPGISSHTTSNIDLLLEIRALKSTQLKVKTEWVEAHQDTKYP